ncbi:unnamed protein product, partial [Amoebophrya sp. A120]|eukprot:GSA120T00011722001.1
MDDVTSYQRQLAPRVLEAALARGEYEEVGTNWKIHKKISSNKELNRWEKEEVLAYVRRVYLANAGALSLLLLQREVVAEQLDARTQLCVARNQSRDYESDAYETCWDDAYDKPPRPRRAPACLEREDARLETALSERAKIFQAVYPEVADEVASFKRQYLGLVDKDGGDPAFTQTKSVMLGAAAANKTSATNIFAGAGRNAVKGMQERNLDAIEDRAQKASIRDMARRKVNRDRVFVSFRGAAGPLEAEPEYGLATAHAGKDKEVTEVSKVITKSALLPKFCANVDACVGDVTAVAKCLQGLHYCLHGTTPNLRGDQRKKAALRTRLPDLELADWWHLVDGRDPLPLHLYCVCLLLYHNKDLAELTFEVGNLHSREEALYVRNLIDSALALLPTGTSGTGNRASAANKPQVGGLGKLRGLASKAVAVKKAVPKVKLAVTCEHPRFLLDAVPAVADLLGRGNNTTTADSDVVVSVGLG